MTRSIKTKIIMPFPILAVLMSVFFIMVYSFVNVQLIRYGTTREHMENLNAGVQEVFRAVQNGILARDHRYAVQSAQASLSVFREMEELARIHPELIAQVRPMYQTFFVRMVSITSLFLENRSQEAQARLDELERGFAEITGRMEQFRRELDAVRAGETSRINTLMFICFPAIAACIMVAFVVARGIAGPVQIMAVIAGRIAQRNAALAETAAAMADGDLTRRPSHSDTHDDHGAPTLKCMEYTQRKDEIGTLCTAFLELGRRQDALTEAFGRMNHNMNELMTRIREIAVQVSSGSNQIAAAGQSLSDGAAHSAASLEQITSSMNQIASQTALNADNAHQANLLASSARDAAARGSARMSEMIMAMGEINTSSKQISKIIKVIDDIAFQTNLLALNAAVEAARAGRHGKGFAVVAEEVRSLAARSARAAGETAELIDSSGARVEKGAEIANQTAEVLNEIVDGITRAADLVSEISAADNEQALGAAQIGRGLEQIDTVTQQNSANAEETASAAEQLSGRAGELMSMLGRFRLEETSPAQNDTERPRRAVLDSGQAGPEPLSTPTVTPGSAVSRNKTGGNPKLNLPKTIMLDDSEFGKY